MIKKNKSLSWITSKRNYPYTILLLLGLIIGAYKYSFTSTITGFSIVIAIGFITGLKINKLIK